MAKKPLSFEQQLEELVKGTRSINISRDGGGITMSATYGTGHSCIAFAGTIPGAMKNLKSKLIQGKSLAGVK